jgi:U3 small nucleolar RNA-associated protein 20
LVTVISHPRVALAAALLLAGATASADPGRRSYQSLPPLPSASNHASAKSNGLPNADGHKPGNGHGYGHDDGHDNGRGHDIGRGHGHDDDHNDSPG